MRHGKKGRKLGRTRSHRQAMLKNLVQALFSYEEVRTTVQKAKEARKLAERLITFAKEKTLAAQRQVLRFIPDKSLVKKLFSEIAPRFDSRVGGYTRIIRIGNRLGDNAEMAILRLVVKAKKEEKAKKKKEGS